jgi:hypothetical protein
MGKPPDDVNPEHFIIGRGSYSNLRLAVPYADEREFRIDPAPMPRKAIIFMNLVFIVFYSGFHWVAKNWPGEQAHFLIVYVLPFVMCLLTCVGVTWITLWFHTRAQKRGPWLVYDKATRRVTLPREQVEFDFQDVVHLQYITTKRLDLGRVTNNDSCSELNIVTSRNGERERWHLLNSWANVLAFEYLVRPLVEQTDIPVVRIKDQMFGWDVTVEPFTG